MYITNISAISVLLRLKRITMLRLVLKKYHNRFLSRWTVFLIDLFVSGLAFILAVGMRFNFSITPVKANLQLNDSAFLLVIYAMGILIVGSHKGILRHTSLEDVTNVVKSSSLSFFIVIGLSLIRYITLGKPVMPTSIIIGHYTFSMVGLVGLRLAAKGIYMAGTRQRSSLVNILIFGAGSNGLLTKNALKQEQRGRFRIVGFTDDNANQWNKSLQDVKVYPPKKALKKEWLRENEIDQLVIAIESLDSKRKQEVTDAAIAAGVEVKIVPPYQKWIDGSITANQLKKVRIEDLLQRNKIELDRQNVHDNVDGKVVMVTGAAGSIGSEIARQLSYYNLKALILVDHAESPLYDIEQELKEKSRSQCTIAPICELASVKDRYRMNLLFEKHKPQLIFHAAAYKHVPIIENAPYEGVYVNVIGTRIVADLAVAHGAEKFVMVSTDKAVNPTNVMGATKRLAELYTQSLNGVGTTRFIATRFGNVLGSNGSVVPLFRKQIEAGGPITVTHKDITRYFMTIPEACNLVLEAGAMGEGGEVFVFDMGEPVRIYDMAKKMVRLSGLEPDRDIQIKITGLRPGEKLYEELLVSSENTLPTHHPKILKAQVQSVGHQEMKSNLDDLAEIMIDGNILAMVKTIKAIVPEYKSQNSEFEVLDK
jgi:FlaA1/EpsC-like NDP-sugar epimerase